MGRWSDIWRDVVDVVGGQGFEERVRLGQRLARGEFERVEVREFLREPGEWARGIKGPLEKVELR
jgi:hypothetical protein